MTKQENGGRGRRGKDNRSAEDEIQYKFRLPVSDVVLSGRHGSTAGWDLSVQVRSRISRTGPSMVITVNYRDSPRKVL